MERYGETCYIFFLFDTERFTNFLTDIYNTFNYMKRHLASSRYGTAPRATAPVLRTEEMAEPTRPALLDPAPPVSSGDAGFAPAFYRTVERCLL